jgi:hypothetical protein
LRAGTVRIPKDDLPDGEREIFLEKGLDNERTEGRSAQVICPSGKWGTIARICRSPGERIVTNSSAAVGGTVTDVAR